MYVSEALLYVQCTVIEIVFFLLLLYSFTWVYHEFMSATGSCTVAHDIVHWLSICANSQDHVQGLRTMYSASGHCMKPQILVGSGSGS